MAIILDFPTNFEEKMRQADELLEKHYVDQAICLLEEFIEESRPTQGLLHLKKKLLTCYFLKKEFENCEEVLQELIHNHEDLTVVAHQLLMVRFTKGEDEMIKLQKEYEKSMKESRFAYKNLVELMMQLKTFYEAYWFEETSEKINAFVNSQSFEEQLLTLSDLQDIEKEELEWFKSDIYLTFERKLNPISQTLLYELLVQKELEWELEFKDLKGSLCLITTSEQLHPFHEILMNISPEVEKRGIVEPMREMLLQHMTLFYQFCFPFYTHLDMNCVLDGIMLFLEGERATFLSEDDYDSTNKTIIDYTSCKLSQYLLSLSSLM